MKTKTAESKSEPLTGKGRRHLRALGHSLDAVIQIGKTGISNALLEEFDQALAAHELVKVRLMRECPVERGEAAEQLATQSGAEHVQTVGNVLLFYRQRPEKPSLDVPGVKKPAAKATANAKAKAQLQHRAKTPPRAIGWRSHAAERGRAAKRMQSRTPKA